MVVYTDGSGYQGRVGAGVVVGLDRAWKIASQMGTEEISTVYSAEIRAIEMGLTLVRNRILQGFWEEKLADAGLVIFANSQPALRALYRPRMSLCSSPINSRGVTPLTPPLLILISLTPAVVGLRLIYSSPLSLKR